MNHNSSDWNRYYTDLAEHHRRMDSIRPKEEDYDDFIKFYRAMLAWDMKRVCDAPNKPGYEYANNH